MRDPSTPDRRATDTDPIMYETISMPDEPLVACVRRPDGTVEERLMTVPTDDRAPSSPDPDSSGGVDPTHPIGPGNPPRSGTWEKGGPSPNPKGRPPKPEEGPWTKLLHQIRPGTNMTYLEAINIQLLVESGKGKAGAIKLLEEREEREAYINEQIAELERQEREREIERARNPRQYQDSKFRQGQQMVHDIHHRAFLAIPGLNDVITELKKLRALESGGYEIAASLRPYLETPEE